MDLARKEKRTTLKNLRGINRVLDKIGLPAHEGSSSRLHFALQCHLVTVSVILLTISVFSVYFYIF